MVWGGSDNIVKLDTGGRYDPVADIWQPTSIVDAPGARSLHTAVWSGSHMIVWGGFTLSYPNPYMGGRYALGNAVDDDGDGLSECDGDCNDVDAGAFAIPQEVSSLAFDGDKITLSWNSAAPSAGASTVHDVVRGLVSVFPVGSGFSAVCIASGISSATTMDPVIPPTGNGYWYLVRGRNTCGPGTYGFESGGTERTTTVCP